MKKRIRRPERRSLVPHQKPGVWDPLRSHVPNLRRDGSEPVDGTMSTDGFSFVGVSLGMKHHF